MSLQTSGLPHHLLPRRWKANKAVFREEEEQEKCPGELTVHGGIPGIYFRGTFKYKCIQASSTSQPTSSLISFVKRFPVYQFIYTCIFNYKYISPQRLSFTMNIRDMLNPVTEGPERPRLRRRTPAPAAPRQPSQPPPPTAPPVQTRLREWVLIARGDFPKGQPHRDNKFVRLNPPLHDGEEQLKYHIPFLPFPEVGPYEILDEHIIQSPIPINAKPELPGSELHEDALKVFEDTSYEKVVRVWVERESAGESRKAVFVRVAHVRRLPRIGGWQVVKKSGCGALTRYMVMVAPGATGQTPLSWVWMTVPEIREQLPERCDGLIQEYREYNPNLLQAEAEAEERALKERAPAHLKRRQKNQPTQTETTPGEDSTTEADDGEGEATEVDSDGYDQPPLPKRQRISPVAGYMVAAQALPAAQRSSPAPSLPRDILNTNLLYDQEESSSNLTRLASNQRVSSQEPQLLNELEQGSPPRPQAPTGPTFTPINFNPPMPTPSRRDLSRLQPLGDTQRLRPFVARRDITPGLSPRSLDWGPIASFSKGGVDIDDLDLFPPEPRPPGAPPAPNVGGLELDDSDLDLDLDLDLDRAIPPGRSRIPPPHQSLTKPTSPPAPAAPVVTTSPHPVRHSPSVPTRLSTESPLSTLRPSPSPPTPITIRASPAELAPLHLESPLLRGSVYPQPVADELPVRRSARLGARGQAAVPGVLMKPLAKERLIKAKKRGAPAPTPSSSTALEQRGRSRPVTATAAAGAVQGLLEAAIGGLEPVLRRAHGRPKGGVGEKKVARGRTETGAGAETPTTVGSHGQRGRKSQPERARGVKGKGTKKGREKK